MKPTLALLAAGMSTRYGRLKQLEPVGPDGEALLDYAVYDARRVGVTRVVLIIREELEEAFRTHVRGRWPEDLDVVYHHQRPTDLPNPDSLQIQAAALSELVETRKKPWGTAHALLTARDRLPGPFALVNADDFYGADAYRRAVAFLQDREPPRSTGPGATPPMFREHVSPSLEPPVPTFGLITYTLRDTLSDHGGVSRGVCRVGDDGRLRTIEEILDIRRGPTGSAGGGIADGVAGRDSSNGLAGRTVDGNPVNLTGDEPISTNFWLFTPVVFRLLEGAFVPFLEQAVKSSSGSQPEFLIPSVVNQAMESGEARVRTYPTGGRFLGITHPQDRPAVVAGLKEMAEAGIYPAPLWS
jgi:hypothetical protein